MIRAIALWEDPAEDLAEDPGRNASSAAGKRSAGQYAGGIP